MSLGLVIGQYTVHIERSLLVTIHAHEIYSYGSKNDHANKITIKQNISEVSRLKGKYLLDQNRAFSRRFYMAEE